MDREHDAEQLLQAYSSTNHWYTVRANANRRIQTEKGSARYVRDVIAEKKTHQGTFALDIPAGHKRSARTATISMRAAKVTLLLRDQRTERTREFETHAVYAFESSYVPDGEERIKWLLYTNHPIETTEDLALILFGYTQRWRVEESLRAWKTTGCHVEEAQLHSAQSVRIWGTMLAATAARMDVCFDFALRSANDPTTIVRHSRCDPPVKQPLTPRVPETTLRELPGGRGFLRVVDGGKSKTAAPTTTPIALTPVSTVASATPSASSVVPVADANGQYDLFSWRPNQLIFPGCD